MPVHIVRRAEYASGRKGLTMVFLPLSPDEVMEEIGRLLDLQRREQKPSAWVFHECNAWEDRLHSRVASAYGNYYHISAQARRVADREITKDDMAQDLRRMHAAYWSPLQVLKRFFLFTAKITAVGLMFTVVGLANYGLSLWIGSVPAAGIIIGILLAIILVPQALNEIWKWNQKRNDDKSVNYQQTFLQKLGRNADAHCPKCGKYVGDLPVEADGAVYCACGNRIERKPPA
jgi:hypothetical protein